MLKRLSIRRLTITTCALLVVGLIYLFPNNNRINIKKDISYINEEELHEVYLIDRNDYVSIVSIPLNNVGEENILKEKLELLIIDGNKKEDIPHGFKPIIPNSTKILELKLIDESVIVNFSKDFLNISPMDEERMIEAIVFTLTSDKKVSTVTIKVEGEVLERLPNSKKLLPIPLTREYGVNKFYDFNNLHGLTQTTIYYIGKLEDETYYIPVTKINNDNREKITVIIDELKSNVIYQSNLSSYLNANAELKKYEILEKAMHLSFNDKIFDSVNSNDILEEVEYSISLSVKENYDVDKVMFYVDDKLIEN